MWEKMKLRLKPFIGYIVVLLCVLSIITIMALFGGVFMSFLGFQYKTVGWLIVFFVIVTLVSLPLEAFANAITEILVKCGLAKRHFGIVYILIDVCSSYVAMRIVDHFMDTIVAGRLSVLLFAVTMSLITVYLERRA